MKLLNILNFVQNNRALYKEVSIRAIYKKYQGKTKVILNYFIIINISYSQKYRRNEKKKRNR